MQSTSAMPSALAEVLRDIYAASHDRHRHQPRLARVLTDIDARGGHVEDAHRLLNRRLIEEAREAQEAMFDNVPV